MFGHHEWEFRGSIENDAAYTFFSVRGPSGGGGGGGGGGALPFQDLGWKVLRHFGSTGWVGGDLYSGQPQCVEGVVSSAAANVRVRFSDGSESNALVLDSGRPEFRFFVLPFAPTLNWTALEALDASGNELDRTINSPWNSGTEEG